MTQRWEIDLHNQNKHLRCIVNKNQNLMGGTETWDLTDAWLRRPGKVFAPGHYSPSDRMDARVEPLSMTGKDLEIGWRQQ
jgi:hypothetical protein